jgi:hypothetical protein
VAISEASVPSANTERHLKIKVMMTGTQEESMEFESLF